MANKKNHNNNKTVEVGYLCRCNNCYSILNDMNERGDADLFPLKGTELDMVKGADGEWVCPLCGVDDYLVDMDDIIDLDPFYQMN